MRKDSVRTSEISEELQKKIDYALEAIRNKKQRFLECPYCKHKAFQVHENTTGYITAKCSKCGRITTFDLLRMRRTQDKKVSFTY